MQSHAIEAISADAWNLMGLALGLLEHGHSALLTPSLLPTMAMFVVDSRAAMRVLNPELARSLEDEFLSQLAPLRRRAKLLDDRLLSVQEAARELTEIAANQTQFFLGLHSGLLAPLSRALQPDLGLTTYDDHLISTTHFTAAIVGWTDNSDAQGLGVRIATAASEFASYGLNLLLGLDLGMPEPFSPAPLRARVIVRDAHSPSLYQRGLLGSIPHELAVGAVGVLVTVNHLRRVVLPVLPAASLTAFRLKMITAFHADSYLSYLQSRLYCSNSDQQLKTLLAAALGQPAGRWLRRRKALRNTIVHYLTATEDQSCIGAARAQVLERLGAKSLDEMNQLADSHLEAIARALEEALEFTNGVNIGTVVH